MIPYPHQEQLSTVALEVLRANGWVYLAWEERTGKTLAAILTAEKSKAERILVITKKKAEAGWVKTLNEFEHEKYFRVTTYHQAHKVVGTYDLVILDEAHNYISSFPKTGTLWKTVKPLCKGAPIIYISATPHAQGYSMLFHQLALCDWGPWSKHKNFYQWFSMYGRPYSLEINGIEIPQYDRVKSEMVLPQVEDCFITKTRAELGFEHEPEDMLHYIPLAANTIAVYNTLLKDQLIKLSVGLLVADNASKMRTSLHQLEGGTIKIDKNYFVLANQEKIDYIKEHWGDSKDLVIMYNFIAEKTKLEKHFKNATILQATSYAEGVDLSGYANLVIYSQDYSTARHTQRRARQANMERKTSITVHFLLVAKGISSQVYKTVSVNKKNYVDSVFSKVYL